MIEQQEHTPEETWKYITTQAALAFCQELFEGRPEFGEIPEKEMVQYVKKAAEKVAYQMAFQGMVAAFMEKLKQ